MMDELNRKFYYNAVNQWIKICLTFDYLLTI